MTHPVHPVRVVGLSELKHAQAKGETIVSTVSKAPQEWQRELSPFYLGPVPLYDQHVSRCMENAWQYAKVYACHVDAAGLPTPAYWQWARDGWAKSAVRYPMGKGAKPEYLLWEGEQLDYLTARARVYWSLYQGAVRETRGFLELCRLHAQGPITLFDFDGYDNDARKMSLRAVANHAARPMGHAFVLKAMLLYGPDVRVSTLDMSWEQESVRFLGARAQAELF